MNFADIKYLATQTVKEWSEDKAARLAASLSYYTVFSIPPLLILFLVVAGQLYDQTAVRTQLIDQISGLVGPTGAEAIGMILDNASSPEGTIIATLVSFATLLFGASGVFGQLQDALNTIWNVEIVESGLLLTIQKRFFSFTMVLGVAFLLMVSLVVSSWLAALNTFVSDVIPTLVILAQIVNFMVSLVVISVLFALIFKVVPDIKIAWGDVWIGAIVTALLFTIGKWGIGLYLGNSAPSSTYGAAGSLIVILLWVYYSAQILFFGAEFTQVYANKFGSGVKADEGAKLVWDAGQTAPPSASNDSMRGWPALETAVHAHQARQAIDHQPAPPPQVPDALKPVEQLVGQLQKAVVSVFGAILASWLLLKRLTSNI